MAKEVNICIKMILCWAGNGVPIEFSKPQPLKLPLKGVEDEELPSSDLGKGKIIASKGLIAVKSRDLVSCSDVSVNNL